MCDQQGSDQHAHMRILIRAFASRLNFLSVKLLTENHLEFLSLKGGYICLYESALSRYHIVETHMLRLIYFIQMPISSKTATHTETVHNFNHVQFCTKFIFCTIPVTYQNIKLSHIFK